MLPVTIMWTPIKILLNPEIVNIYDMYLSPQISGSIFMTKNVERYDNN